MRNHPRLLLVMLIIASGGLYLIGNDSVALWDRDEPRYAQTSRQMLQSGDWVVPHYLDLVRTAKPVLIYWCEAGAMRVFGDNAFAARFPSAMGTVVLLFLLSVVLWKPVGPERTFWTVFIFATSGLTIAAAKMCMTDAVQLVWITIAELCLYSIWRRRASWLVVLTMAVAIGLAGLTKGPVVLGFLGATLLTLLIFRWIDRKYPPMGAKELDAGSEDTRWIPAKTIVGLVVIAAVVLPWVMAVNHRASAFLKSAVTHDVWDRMMTPLEQHTGPPGYYLLTIWVTFFPWSIFIPMAIAVGIWNRANPRTRFALAAVIGPWIMLECIRTKLPHYFLPAFPPLAFLTADALMRCLRGEQNDLKSKPFQIAIGIWALLFALIGSAPWLGMYFHQSLPVAAMCTLSVVSGFAALAAFFAFRARRAANGLIRMGIGMMVVVALIYGWYLPRATFLRLSPRVAEVLIANDVVHPHEVIMMDYMEPSLAFYQGGTIRETGDVGLNIRSIPLLTPWIVVTQDIWKTAPLEIQDRFEVVNRIGGWAYADKGRWIEVVILRRKGLLPVSSGQ